MVKTLKNITSDKLAVNGCKTGCVFFYPFMNIVFDEKGNDIGRYTVKKGELEAIIDL